MAGLIDVVAEDILFLISRRLLIKRGMWGKGEDDDKPMSEVKRKQGEDIELVLQKSIKFVELTHKVVVDFGCSDGIKTKDIAKRCRLCLGVDIDTKAIEEAKKNKLNNMEFRIGSHDSVPIDDAEVDIVMCIDTWEHVLQPEKILDEFHRVLSPDGLVFLYFAPWYYPTGGHTEPHIHLPWCHIFFSEKTIIKTILRIHNSDFFYPHTPRQDANELYGGGSITQGFLNRMSERQFRRLLRVYRWERKFDCIHYELLGFCGRTSKFARLSRPFRYLPMLREFIGGYVFCVLRKIDELVRSQAAI